MSATRARVEKVPVNNRAWTTVDTIPDFPLVIVDNVYLCCGNCDAVVFMVIMDRRFSIYELVRAVNTHVIGKHLGDKGVLNNNIGPRAR